MKKKKMMMKMYRKEKRNKISKYNQCVFFLWTSPISREFIFNIAPLLAARVHMYIIYIYYFPRA